MGRSSIIPTSVEGIKRLARSYVNAWGCAIMRRLTGRQGTPVLLPLPLPCAPCFGLRTIMKLHCHQRRSLENAARTGCRRLRGRRLSGRERSCPPGSEKQVSELAAYAIIARTEVDASERRWVLLKGSGPLKN
jgi:hypothetical protein